MQATEQKLQARRQRILDIRQVHHDILGRAAGQPPELFRRAHIGFEMRNEHRLAGSHSSMLALTERVPEILR
jgi:hypothetical protein